MNCTSEHDKSDAAKFRPESLLAWFVRGSAHLVGVLVVMSLSLWLQFNEAAWRALEMTFGTGHLWHLAAPSLVAQLLLCAVVWALLVAGVHLGARLVESARKDRRPVILKRAGSVMLETLIVFPVFLFMLGGLLQLILNNTAAVVTSLASFQAARAVMLWEPETVEDNERVDQQIGQEQVVERARVAAASILAAVAPADYAGKCDHEPTESTVAEAKMDSLGLIGAGGTSLGQHALEAGTEENLTVASAFDSKSFFLRSSLKFYQAYCNTDVEYTLHEQPGDPYGADASAQYYDVKVTYDHMQTVPWVGYLFSEKTASPSNARGVISGGANVLGGGSFGTIRYSTIRRQFSLPKITNPNDVPPSSLDALLNGDDSANPLNDRTDRSNMGVNTAN